MPTPSNFYSIFDLSVEKLYSLRGPKAVIAIPIGILEDHGPTLPFGQDPLMAAEYLRQLAASTESEQITWICFPPLPIGRQATGSGTALVIRPHASRDFLIDLIRPIYKMGFEKFVLVSQTFTPKQCAFLEELPKWIRGAQILPLSLIDRTAEETALSIFSTRGLEHGGAWDEVLQNSLINNKGSLDPRIQSKIQIWTKVVSHWITTNKKTNEARTNFGKSLILKTLFPVYIMAFVASLIILYSVTLGMLD